MPDNGAEIIVQFKQRSLGFSKKENVIPLPVKDIDRKFQGIDSKSNWNSRAGGRGLPGGPMQKFKVENSKESRFNRLEKSNGVNLM